MANNIYFQLGAPTWHPGFFCCYQTVIGFLNRCEADVPAGYKVFFERGLYFDSTVGPNWWEYYFEPIGSGQPIKIIEHVSDVEKSAFGTEVISTMSRGRAAEIINKYIKVKSHMQNKIDQFIQTNFDHNYTVGIHYRGTDKSSEAPRVPFDSVRDEIKKHISDKSSYKIFVATDENQFINYMRSQFGDRVVYTNAKRSAGNEPIHHNGGNMVDNRYMLGEDAVIDCYLLSKTNIMIRTQSNLSSSAANINPSLLVIDLNHAHYRVGLR